MTPSITRSHPGWAKPGLNQVWAGFGPGQALHYDTQYGSGVKGSKPVSTRPNAMPSLTLCRNLSLWGFVSIQEYVFQ